MSIKNLFLNLRWRNKASKCWLHPFGRKTFLALFCKKFLFTTFSAKIKNRTFLSFVKILQNIYTSYILYILLFFSFFIYCIFYMICIFCCFFPLFCAQSLGLIERRQLGSKPFCKRQNSDKKQPTFALIQLWTQLIARNWFYCFFCFFSFMFYSSHKKVFCLLPC